MKTRTLCLFVVLAASSAQARPFKDVCEQFEPLRKISDLKHMKSEIKVQPKTEGVKPQDVVFTIAAKSGTMKISPGPDGAVTLPYDDDKLCAENPDFETNQPKGSVALGISIEPRLPPVRTLDYRVLDSLRKEWIEAIARQSLLWRMLAPSSKGYKIEFEPGKGGSAEIRLSEGIRKLIANEKGELRIPFEDAWIAANPTIVLSDLPKKIGLAFD